MSKESQRIYDAKRRAEQKAAEGEAQFLERMRVKQALGDARRGPVVKMLTDAKARARRDGVPFDLKKGDVHLPTHCPVLGILLGKGTPNNHNNSPSLDRINPTLGYVKGNVAVISHKANRLKGEATADDHIRIAIWIKHNTPIGSQSLEMK
jgi:hypothetical protein